MTDNQPDATSPTTTTKKRTAFVRAKAYPNGSTAPLRHSVLQVLGVLKVATVKQVWQLAQPDHEKPNTTASALRDLALNRLTEKRGTTTGRPLKAGPPTRPPSTATRPRPCR